MSWLLVAASPALGFDFLAKWGSAGSADGQFAITSPRGAFVHPATGNVYVADTNNDRVQVFTPGGQFLFKWGSAGTGNGELDDVRNVAIDADGNVYAADSNNNRVQKFSSSGTFITKWGRNGGDGMSGTGAGEFSGLSGIATDSQGSVYVPDLGNNRIQQFTSSGAFQRMWGFDVTVGGGTGFEVCTAGCQAGVAGPGDGQFDQPTGVAVDSQGSIYVADSNNDRVQKFVSSGAFITKWGRNGGDGSSGTGLGEFNSARGVAVGPSDTVYVADQSNHRVQQFTSTGAFQRMWGFDVAVGGGTGFEICTAGCQAGVLGVGDGQFDTPRGVAADCRDNVYVADDGNSRVQKFGEPGADDPPCLAAAPSPAAPSPGAGALADTSAPKLALRGNGRQRIVRQRGAIIVTAQCDEPCLLVASARVSVPRVSKLFRVRQVRRSLPANTRARLRLKLSKKAFSAAKRALGRRKRIRASVRIRATDAAGNGTTASRKVRLVR